MSGSRYLLSLRGVINPHKAASSVKIGEWPLINFALRCPTDLAP